MASAAAAAPPSSASDVHAHATHLVVFQHGLWGNAKDFRNFQALFTQYFPQDEVYAYVATCNATTLSSVFQTYDGIDAGGTRLADEIESVAKRLPRVSKLSLVGHSLGGLYARYAVGVLYARGFFEHVEPMNFVTLATPHMGIRRSQPTPMNTVFNSIMPNFFDLTGAQFTLTDTASAQAIALSHSVRRYPHRRPNVTTTEIDDMLLVRLPLLDAQVEAHPKTATRAETQAFEVLECVLREGILRMYRKLLEPSEGQERTDESTGTDGEQATEAIDDEASENDERKTTPFNVLCVAEIDLAHARVTVVLPEKGGTRRRRRRRHSVLLRRASDMPQNEDGSFWDVVIEVDRATDSELSTETDAETEIQINGRDRATVATYTVRIPYDELVAKWKWIAALSNASHGVHCRSQSSPATPKDVLVNSTAPTVLSCLTRGQFIQALQLFRSRSLYSSIFNDMQVPYSCGAIRAYNPYRTELDPSEAVRSPHYQHVVTRSLWNAPLLRDTLPEEIKNRDDRASSIDRFSFVKMLSERSTSRRRYSNASSSRDQSFSTFFSNLTSSNTSSNTSSSSRTRLNRARSELPPMAPLPASASSSTIASSSSATIHQRLDAIPPAPSNSLRLNTAERDVDSTDSEDSSHSSDASVSDGKRMPPFEDGALLLDHADQAFSNDELRDALRGMMVSLQSVGWRRIDVHFHSPLAHMKIIAMTASPAKPLTKGLDIVHHVMDTFLL